MNRWLRVTWVKDGSTRLVSVVGLDTVAITAGGARLTWLDGHFLGVEESLDDVTAALVRLGDKVEVARPVTAERPSLRPAGPVFCRCGAPTIPGVDFCEKCGG